MSKRSEEAAFQLFPIQMELVPLPDGDTIEEDVNRWKRGFAKIGYEQAEKDLVGRPVEGLDLDSEIFFWQKAHANEDTAQVIAMTARHFAEWGAEHAKTPTP